MSILNKGIEILEKFFESRVDESFTVPMLKINWGTVNSVGDTSKFIGNTINVISWHLSQVQPFLGEFYFGVYFNRIVVLINNKFINTLYSCKRIS